MSLCKEDHFRIGHMLSGCYLTLQQGRYLYRLYQVLSGIMKTQFVKEETKKKKDRKLELGILHRARDFVVDGNLNKELKFPAHIACDVSCRLDILISSNSICLIELTCLWEKRP